MTNPRDSTPRDSTLRDDVPEADLLDQLTPVDPDAADAPTSSPGWDTDPADAHDQATVVGLDDDAYPHRSEDDDTSGDDVPA